MPDKTPFQEVADLYASKDRDTMEFLRDLDEDSLRELDRTLQGVSNSIEILLGE